MKNEREFNGGVDWPQTHNQQCGIERMKFEQ